VQGVEYFADRTHLRETYREGRETSGMITTSDIVLKLLKERGYKSPNSFALSNGISFANFLKAIRENMWTEEMLKRVGDALGEDLSMFVTAKVGISKGVKYYEK
jgi:hypothetical protein